MCKLYCWNALVGFFSLLMIQNAAAAPHVLPMYIGSYTTDANPVGNGAGIYRVGLNLDSGEIIPSLYLAASTINPSYILIDKNKLYAVNEVDNFLGKSTGSVSAFNIKPDGELALINQVSSGGANPVSLTHDKDWQSIVVANYGNGNPGSAGVAVFPLNSSGALQDAAQMITYTGSGLDKEHQAAPHTHAVNGLWVADKQLIFSVDLGLDKIFVYTLDSETGFLTQSSATLIANKAHPESPTGSRHITVSPNKKYLYLGNELSSDIYVYQLNPDTGSLKFVQQIKSYMGQLHTQRNYPAEIMLNSNGHYLYVSNRGQNTLAQFKINTKTGKLSYIGEVSTYGDFPRDFDIDASGRYLVVANQKSDNVTLFNINSINGNLINPVTFNVPTPVTVKFANE